MICCTSCHRVYHLSCISKDDLPEDDVKNKFMCNVCKVGFYSKSYSFYEETYYTISCFMFQRCSNEDLTPHIKKSQLNRLVKYTATKMKDRVSFYV